MRKMSVLLATLFVFTIGYTQDLQSDERLKESSFVRMKTKVSSYLDGSWCSKEKSDLIMDVIHLSKPQVCVEIGLFSGSSFLPIIAALSFEKQGRAYGIDAWSNEESISGVPSTDPNHSWWSTVDMSQVKKNCISMIQHWKLLKYCTIIHDSSKNAVKHLPSIDFLHFDGNFSESGSLEDVHLFLPKVKKGGYVLLSNLFHTVDGINSKMSTMWYLMDCCELICEIDSRNTILLRKV